MKRLKSIAALLLVIIFSHTNTKAQSLYFPPLIGSTWDTISPQSLGWCQSRINVLYNYLDSNNTKAFIVLKNGKIVLEKYFGTFTQDSLHVWNSAGKSLTAFLVGLAQEQGHLSITDTVSDYLGIGWTGETPAKEEKITIRHLLSMTSGIDSAECTNPVCFTYQADAGTRWDYNSAAYTMLHYVMDTATGNPLNTYTAQNLKIYTGMTGTFIPIQYHQIFVSNARSAARFGLLMLNKGNWNGNQIMTDTSYFNQMINTSQALNKSYGYLWWLNDKPSYMIPGSQFVFNGSLLPHAPNDMYEAMGKGGQFIDVVPSENIVLIRMGEKPNSVLVPFEMNDSIWKYMDSLQCPAEIETNNSSHNNAVNLFPNPSNNIVNITSSKSFISQIEIFNILGEKLKAIAENAKRVSIPISELPKGCYFVNIKLNNGNFQVRKIMKE